MAVAHGLDPARRHCPHRPGAAALRGRGWRGAPRPCAGQVYSPCGAKTPCVGRRGGVRQERRSPRRNCVGVEKGKKKLKSKDPTSRRIKARRGASSSELPLFFFFNFYFPSGAEGSGIQAGGPQRTCREMRWIPPERRRSPYLPAGPLASCAAAERDKGRAPGGAARPTDAHRRGGRGAAPKCQRGRARPGPAV